MIEEVVGRATEHVSIKFSGFFSQNFISPGTKNIHFDAKIAPIPFWVREALRSGTNFWRRVFRSFLQKFKMKFEKL